MTQDNMFKASPLFYGGMFLHIIVMELVARYLLLDGGSESWVWWLSAVLLCATAQAQAGWLQHDFGHLSVFQKSQWNHLWHNITIGHLKGASTAWWNSR